MSLHGDYDPDNIFARILRGEIPSDKVAENDHAIAFRDIRPQALAPERMVVVVGAGREQVEAAVANVNGGTP